MLNRNIMQKNEMEKETNNSLNTESYVMAIICNIDQKFSPDV